MAAKAILHIQKLKNAGSIGGLGMHLTRERMPKNADPTKSHLNERLAGSGDLNAELWFPSMSAVA